MSAGSLRDRGTAPRTATAGATIAVAERAGDSVPFMSIVLCAYNSEAVIARALDSLLAQNYPDDLFEVIVVDDASTDRTAEIARRYPVRVVVHSENRGLGSARGTGLDHARGDVFVCFDDDCTVGPEWLGNLAKGYQQLDAVGIGSVVHQPTEHRGLADRFLAACTSNSPPLELGVSKHPLRRFLAYVVDQMNPRSEYSGIIPVCELNGASATFRMTVLNAVGGWNRSLRLTEDIDICARIRQAYPEAKFYTISTARVTHDDLRFTLRKLVRRSYVRGPETLRYYHRNGLMPPIFPYPLAWLLAVACAGIVEGPLWCLPAALIAPYLLYLWWPVRAVRERSFWPLLFGYVQLAEESATIAGLARAKVGALLPSAGARSAKRR